VVAPDRVGLAVALVAAIGQLAPVLGRGYVLLRDMVFVPRLPLTPQLLGVNGVPRAVPSDLLVALLSRLVPGDAVQDVVLAAVIVLGGWGAARLVPSSSPAAAAAASALYAWNPYLTERLLLGQWAVLLGYAAAPWAARAALDLREDRPRALRRMLLALALAAAGGASAELLAALVVVPVAAWPGGPGWLRRLAATAASLVVVALPWLVPSLLQPGSAPADRVGAAAFAARPDTPLGSLGSLLTLGGVWNADAVPPGRDDWLVAIAALAVTAAALWALAVTRRRWPAGGFPGLVLAGVIGLLLAAWGATPGARALLAHLVAAAQPVGLLRDGQRQLAPFVLVVAVGFGLATERALAAGRRALVLVVVPAALLPAAAWGADGALVAVSWPGGWSQVATAAHRLAPGPVLLLPWSTERAFGWNGNRPLTDPAGHWLSPRTVGDDQLVVGSLVTPLEDPLARQVAAVATGAGPLLPALRARGYTGVLVQRDQPGAPGLTGRLAGLRLVTAAPGLALYAVPGSHRTVLPSGSVPAALAADAVAAAAVLLAAASCAWERTERRSARYRRGDRRGDPAAGQGGSDTA